MKAILLASFVFVIEIAGEPCSTAGHLPVVNICTKETAFEDDANSILVKSDMRQNCTCEITLTDQNLTKIIYFQKFDNQFSSVPSNSDCGLQLQYSVGQDIFGGANCFGVITVSKPIVKKNVFTITSMPVNGTLREHEGFCIEIKKVDHLERGMLNLTCGIGSTTTTQTTTQSTESSPMRTINSSPTTITTPVSAITTAIYTDKFTSTKFIKTDGPESTKQVTQHQTISDSDDTTVLAASASVGGFVIFIVVIVVICIYTRYHKKPISKQSPAFDNEYDAYGMRDNVLYVSSQSTDTVEQQNTKRISVDIDGNYSTVDLDEIPSVEDSTGNNSSLDKQSPTATTMNRSSNKKPIIAQKPKQKVAIQDDVYAVPDKKRVKHVTSPGENGCEYAVVRKPNKSNADKSEDQPSRSNVYAVVAKTKRISDGKGTNQKRDSLTSENDKENGRSSKS